MTLQHLAVTLSLLFFLALPAHAQIRCPLDVSNPAITHTAIPLHTPIQGVTSYAGPEEWPFFSHQSHWTPSDAVVPPTGPMLGHIHIEVCYPYFGLIYGAVTIPFRVQIFHNATTLSNLQGPTVRDVVWDATGTTTPPPLVGNPNGVVLFTGHLTLDPMIGTWGRSTVNGGAVNNWTNFPICVLSYQTNGDQVQGCAFLPIWTNVLAQLGYTEVPWWQSPDTDYVPIQATYTTAMSARDPGGFAGLWGVAVLEVREPLPVLAPLAAPWYAPTMSAYSYAGTGSFMAGTEQMRKDMDLHNGIPGTPIALFRNFDPVELGTGVHKVAAIWQTTGTGPTGSVGLGAPNEQVASLLVVNVTVGDVVPPPPVPTDCIVGPWIMLSTTVTSSAIVTIGTVQTRTLTTGQQQQRTNVPPTNGGAACPLN